MSEISFQEALKRQDLRFYKKSIDSKIIEKFEESLNSYAEDVNEAYKRKENEEYFKKLVNDFLRDNFYSDEKYSINAKGDIDSAISKNNQILCMIEAKSPMNTLEMIEQDNLNKKALHELIYYYLERTRDVSGKSIKFNLTSQIKTLVATNSVKFFVFTSNDIETIVRGEIEKYFFNFKNNVYNANKTGDFYNYVEKYLKENSDLLEKINYVYFDMKQVRDDKSKKLLPSLYKILSKFYLLGEKYIFENSIHTLNKKFYNELLYIMGLVETKKENKKKENIIKLDESIKNSIGHQIYNIFIDKENKTKEEAIDKTFELLIIWLNRILFIKLFEGQLISFNGDKEEYHILNLEKIKSFNDLDNLFFNILGRKVEERRDTEFYSQFISVPYLNSALFERQEIEITGINISEIQNSKVQLKSDSILKNKQEVELPLLEYLIRFLNGYDFASVQIEDNIKEKSKEIIDSSVLGLIFEKINGYKEGSVYTPSMITQYMAEQVVEKTTIQRLNNELNLNCKTLEELAFIIRDKHSLEYYKKVNNIINSITYCDPSVGSGHFLVSLLNRIIYVKYQLGVLMYNETNETVRDFNIYIYDDTLVVENAQGEVFSYNPENALSQKMEETLFNEKKTIIEKCLFGADINPKAVNICQLRLWIELLKNAYYKNKIMQTLPNIDINIKCGNSLLSKVKFRVGEKVDIGKQLDIDSRKKIIKEYKKCVSEYIIEDDKEKKVKIKALIKNFDDFYIHPKIQTSLFEEDNKKDIENRLYENSLEWGLQFPEIIDEDGEFKGFDCVIGNPPYVDSEEMTKKMPDERELYSKLYKTTKGNWDLYIPFWELGFNLLKEKGNIAFITANKWLAIKYGKELRKLLFDHIYNVSDYTDFNAFDSANVSTVVVMAGKEEYDKIKAVKFKSDYSIEREVNVDKNQIREYDNISLCLSNSFNTLKKIIDNEKLIDKFDIIGSATVSETYEIAKIVENIEEPDLDKYFKFINTGTIDKFISTWGKEEMTYVKNKYLYPVVNKEKLKELYPKRYERAILPKLITTGIRYFEVYGDFSGEYLSAKSTEIIIPIADLSIKAVLPILNSNIIFYFIREAYGNISMGGGITFSPDNLCNIPIPSLDDSKIMKLEEMSDKYSENFGTKEQDELDEYIAELFELNDEDKKVIADFKDTLKR